MNLFQASQPTSEENNPTKQHKIQQLLNALIFRQKSQNNETIECFPGNKTGNSGQVMQDFINLICYLLKQLINQLST